MIFETPSGLVRALSLENSNYGVAVRALRGGATMYMAMGFAHAPESDLMYDCTGVVVRNTPMGLVKELRVDYPEVIKKLGFPTRMALTGTALHFVDKPTRVMSMRLGDLSLIALPRAGGTWSVNLMGQLTWEVETPDDRRYVKVLCYNDTWVGGPAARNLVTHGHFGGKVHGWTSKTAVHVQALAPFTIVRADNKYILSVLRDGGWGEYLAGIEEGKPLPISEHHFLRSDDDGEVWLHCMDGGGASPIWLDATGERAAAAQRHLDAAKRPKLESE